MGLTKQFLFGFLSCLLLLGCAGMTIRYYGLAGVIYEHGILLGPEPKYDRQFSDCQPSPQYPKGACVIMFANDFFAYKTDCTDCKNKLIDCQRYPNP